MNDVVINKIQNMQRCVRRAREIYQSNPGSFASDYNLQDASILNVLRTCETAIDLANHAIRVRKLGIPVSSAESFDLLHAERVIDAQLTDRMKKMVAFRNTVVHQYTKTDLAIVEAVIVSGLNDLLLFADKIREYMSSSP